MSVSIVPSCIATFWTALAGMARVNIDYGNTAFGGFVLDEPTELPKSPGVLKETLSFNCTDSLSDITQVFHYDDVSRLAGIDDCLADFMVEVGHPAVFLPRQPFQELLGSVRALGLEHLPQPSIMPADVYSLPSRELQAIGGGSKVIDTAVNTNDVTTFRRKRNFTVDHDVDVELFRAPVVAEGCRSGLLSREKPPLEITNGERELEPPGYC
ncbi:hypothetical protein KKC1_14950 [Calderihabitans maritimus]|uniref:Uncharacterized protein n=1 Tax=Calderihabitans maritimus TaxID=1246530 RepID=A0A1Z5HST2_9FIRM|nr:hypothetical protein KKC1_14950 [Calderihabitans maritimus]